MAETEELQESEEQKPKLMQEAGLGGQGEDSWEGAETIQRRFLSFWKKGNQRFLLIAVGIGGIFFLGGLFFLGLLWVEKYLRKWYNSRN